MVDEEPESLELTPETVKDLTWKQIQALSVDEKRKAVRIDRFDNELNYRQLAPKYHKNFNQLKKIIEGDGGGGGGAKATGKAYNSIELFSLIKNKLSTTDRNTFYDIINELEYRRQAQIEVLGAVAELGWRADNKDFGSCLNGKLDFSLIMWTEDPSFKDLMKKSLDAKDEHVDCAPLGEYNALLARVDELKSELAQEKFKFNNQPFTPTFSIDDWGNFNSNVPWLPYLVNINRSTVMMIKILWENGGYASAEDLSVRLGLHVRTIKGRLSELFERRVITRTDSNPYKYALRKV